MNKTYTNSLLTIFVLIAMFVFFISCNVGKEYVRPQSELNASYLQDFPKDSAITNMNWWELFKDSILVNLIDTALVNNKNLQIAALRVQQSQLYIDISRSDLYPSINYGIVGSSNVHTENSQFTNSLAPVVNVSYTIDLWQRIKNLNNVSVQNFLGSEEAYKALHVSLISSVAHAYISLRDIDNRLIITEKTASNFQANLDVMQAKFNSGIINEVDLLQAKIQLSEAKTAIEVFLRTRGQIENSLNILLGTTAMVIPRGLPLYEQIYLPEIPVGLPSELLDRRPDIMVAERNLHAQTLKIGSAEALKYPSITLSADLGAEVVTPSLLFANVGMQLLGPLFNSKKIKKNVEIEELRTRELLNNYQFTYITAFKEVEDAMIAATTYKNEFKLRNQQMIMATKAAQLSWVRYDGGLTSYLEVLSLQSSQFSSELKASEAFKQEMVSIVKLYEALGGGWN